MIHVTSPRENERRSDGDNLSFGDDDSSSDDDNLSSGGVLVWCSF